MLEPKRFAIPNVNYKALMPNLERTRYTTKNMITNLNNTGFEDVLNLILPNDYESKNPNEIVGFLFDSTLKKIKTYLEDRNDELLLEIFHTIQLWGGNAGRNIYIMGTFDSNFKIESYKESVDMLRSGNPEKAIDAFKNIKQINIAFASKHFSFWSYDLQGTKNKSARQLPVLDRLINELVYGVKNQPTYSNYMEYLSDMYSIVNKVDAGSVHNLERQLFNFADTEEGKNWILNRLNNPEKIKEKDFILV